MFEIGTSLREARARRQIEIPEAEQATKIRSKYLRALEEEQFELLPSPTYVKGFLRSYAEYLGLDGQLYVDEYNSRYVTDEHSETQLRGPRRREGLGRERARAQRRVESSFVLIALGAIVVVTALVFAAWKFGGSSSSQKIQNLGGTTPAVLPPQTTVAKRLVIRAVRGASLLEVHLGSPTGRLLFQGTLEPGKAQSFPARTVWMNVGSAENLRVTLDGRPLRLPRTHGPSRIVVTRTGVVRSPA